MSWPFLTGGDARAAAVAGGGDPRVSEPLHADGMVFRRPDGSAHRVKRASQFRLGQLWAGGRVDEAKAICAWVRDAGGNDVRVFCQYGRGIGKDQPLRPDDISPAQWRAFVDFLASERLRCGLVFLADCEELGQDHVAQVARVAALRAALAGAPNVMGELCNEPFKNGADVARIARALGLDQPQHRPFPMATGDYSCDLGMLVLDWIGDHAERKKAWPGEAGKTGHFIYGGWDPDENSPHGWRGSHCPAIADEPIGCVELPFDQAPDFGRRDNRLEAFEDGFAGFAIGMAGACFHSDAGVQAVVPGPVTDACARRAFAAMDFFPADAPAGRYTHDLFPDHPMAPTTADDESAGRVFDSWAYVVAASPTPAWRQEPQHGWRVTRQLNARGNIVELAR